MTTAGLMVSIRTRHLWRVIRGDGYHCHKQRIVSIRTRHLWRVIPEHERGAIKNRVFQSAPAISGG